MSPGRAAEVLGRPRVPRNSRRWRRSCSPSAGRAAERAQVALHRFCSSSCATLRRAFMGLCGDITWAVLVLVLHSPPVPSLADILYLSSASAIFRGSYLDAVRLDELRRWRQTLDSSMVALLVVCCTGVAASSSGRRSMSRLNWASAVADVGAALRSHRRRLSGDLRDPDRRPSGFRSASASSSSAPSPSPPPGFAYAYLVNVRGIKDGAGSTRTGRRAGSSVIPDASRSCSASSARKKLRLWSTSAWVGTGVVTGLIVVTLADSTAIRTAPLRVLAAMIGLALLLLRLKLTVRDRGRTGRFPRCTSSPRPTCSTGFPRTVVRSSSASPRLRGTLPSAVCRSCSSWPTSITSRS